jgi:hypothetical protein
MLTLPRSISYLALALLIAAPYAGAQNAALHVEPADGQYDGFAAFGTGAAISGRTAVVGAPDLAPVSDDSSPPPNPPYWGVVNVYTTDADRSAWTLSSVLHAEDAADADKYFGSAVALRGDHLIVASIATIRIYERQHGTFELRDKIALTGEVVMESAPIAYANGTLAVKTQASTGNNENLVHVYRINERGKARQVAVITPPDDPQHLGWSAGDLSLDADGGALALGRPRNGASGPAAAVYFYQPARGTWVLKETLTAPSAAAGSFGAAVALEGRKLIVGAPNEGAVYDPESNTVSASGAAYVYRRMNGHWIQLERIGTEDPSQPSAGLHEFGARIASNGRWVWITAPSTGDSNASNVEHGPALLYRWNAGQLEFVTHLDSFTPAGGLDMSRRYVIEGNILWEVLSDGARIVDLSTLAPAAAVDDEPEDGAAD